MIVRSRVRDCLFLNWALEAEALPDAPSPLRYQRHYHEGEDWVFASALLFRQEGLHVTSLPWPKLNYSQATLRLYTLDEDDTPSVLFHRMWVPAWVAPLARWVARQTALSATLRFPGDAVASGEDAVWSARAAGGLTVRGRPGAATLGIGPALGGWEQTVNYFRQRPRGYGLGPSGLRRVETSHVSTSVLPMEIEVERSTLLSRSLLSSGGRWPLLHSAWLCPQLTFDFELVAEKDKALPSHVPAPG